MDNKKENVVEIDLVRLGKALWRRAWAIVLAAVIFGGAAFTYARFMVTPLYTASTLLYVNNSSISVGSTKVNLSDLTAAQSLLETYMVILKTRGTLTEVIEAAELPYSYEQLSDMISAGSVNSTEVMEVKVTSADPQEAEKIANTIADILPARFSSILEGSSVSIVDYAVVPSEKSSPSVSRYTLVGAVLGVVLICALLILLELLDDRVHNEDYVRETFDLPLLAVVPDLLVRGGRGYVRRSYGAPGKEGKA